jgi:hypothetical protein
MKNNLCVLFFITVLTLVCNLCLACSKQSTAGTSTETSNGIAGTIVNAQGEPQPHAYIYLNYSAHSQMALQTIDSTQSSAQGAWSFTFTKPGYYAVRAQHNNTLGWIAASYYNSETITQTDTVLTLNPNATLTGFVKHPLLQEFTARVLVVGSDWEQEVGTDGFFSFTALPRDSLCLRASFYRKSLYSHLGQTCITIQQDSVHLDSFPLFVLNAQAVNDSLLLDDFEDTRKQNYLNTNWYTFADTSTPGASQVSGYPTDEFVIEDTDGNQAASFYYQLGTQAPNYAGFGTNLGVDFISYITDMRTLQGIKVRVKGSGNGTLSACLAAGLLEDKGVLCMPLATAPIEQWQTISLEWDVLNASVTPSQDEFQYNQYLQLINMLNFIVFENTSASANGASSESSDSNPNITSGTWIIDDVWLLF